MKISGNYEFDAPPDRVWDALMDPKTLAGCIPGCDGLDPEGDNQYHAAVDVGVGPVRGRFNARISLRDLNPPDSYRLVIEGNSPVGFANGDATVTLQGQEGKTTVRIDGDAQVGGSVARVGQRLIGSVAQGMLDRMFGCLQQAAR